MTPMKDALKEAFEQCLKELTEEHPVIEVRVITNSAEIQRTVTCEKLLMADGTWETESFENHTFNLQE